MPPALKARLCFTKGAHQVPFHSHSLALSTLGTRYFAKDFENSRIP
ncbi:MAG: hypothetical protein MR878_07510 [Campylobacter sp.]|nr:hypothetical protein [Campylobacter sp.]